METPADTPNEEAAVPEATNHEDVTDQPNQETPANEEAAPENTDSLLKFEGEEDPANDNADSESEGDNVDDDADTPSIYDAFELPEGMEMDKAALDSFAPLMEKVKLDQAGAQEFVTAFSEFRQQEAVAAVQALESQRTADKATINADPELGGDNIEDSIKDVNRALNQHGSKAMYDTLRKAGLDNNPDVFAFLQSVGANLSEGNIVGPGDKQVSTRAADRVFG